MSKKVKIEIVFSRKKDGRYVASFVNPQEDTRGPLGWAIGSDPIRVALDAGRMVQEQLIEGIGIVAGVRQPPVRPGA